MRRVCLGEPVARTGKLPTLSPPLLRHLAAIGNNLNQTARKVNSGQWVFDFIGRCRWQRMDRHPAELRQLAGCQEQGTG